MLRTLLLVNILLIAIAAIRADTFVAFSSLFIQLAAFGELPLIAVLVVLCGMRRLFERLPYIVSLAIVMIIVAALAALAYRLMQTSFPVEIGTGLPRFVLAFTAIAAIVLAYFDLRTRALNPAVTQARLQALQARIRPHFLFNSLNSAVALIRNEPKRAEGALLDLAELFRAQLADNRTLTPITREVELAKQYLNLESLRLGNRLVVNWHIEAMPRDALVPPLLLQPLVENAVAHGIEPTATPEKPGDLDVSIFLTNGQLVIRLTNPFVGNADKHVGNRMAVGNIRERLALHFDAEAQMQTHIAAGRYTVTITIPYTKLKQGGASTRPKTIDKSALNP